VKVASPPLQSQRRIQKFMNKVMMLFQFLSASGAVLRQSSGEFSRIKRVEYGVLQGVPPGHEHLNIGRIKLHSPMIFI
jgi:hypothetical protein